MQPHLTTTSILHNLHPSEAADSQIKAATKSIAREASGQKYTLN